MLVRVDELGGRVGWLDEVRLDGADEACERALLEWRELLDALLGADLDGALDDELDPPPGLSLVPELSR